MRSMTGYGRAKGSNERWHVEVELKAINHKYFSFNVHMPAEYNILEIPISRKIREKLSRGRVELYLQVQPAGEFQRGIEINKDLFNACKQEIEKLGINEEVVSPEFILSLPGVLSIEERPGEQEISELIDASLDEALGKLVEMQNAEGENLKEEIAVHLKKIDTVLKSLKNVLPELRQVIFQRLKRRLDDLIGDKKLDNDRIIIEAGILAEKSDISEEVTRLESHIKQFRNVMDEGGVIGKKLDFLTQEMQRELNTMSAKVMDQRVISEIIDMRSWVEGIREQVQNVV